MISKKKMIMQQKKELRITQAALATTAMVATGSLVGTIMTGVKCSKLKKELEQVKQETSLEISGQLAEVSRLCSENAHDLNVLAKALNKQLPQ